MEPKEEMSPEERALRAYLTAMVAAGWSFESSSPEETKTLTVDEAMEFLASEVNSGPVIWFVQGDRPCSFRLGGKGVL